MKITSLINLHVIKLNHGEYAFSSFSSEAGCSGLHIRVEKKVLNGPVITTDGFSTFHPQGKLSGSKSRRWFVQPAGTMASRWQALAGSSISPRALQVATVAGTLTRGITKAALSLASAQM